MIPHVNDGKGDIDSDEIPFAIENKNIKWYDRLLLNRPIKIILPLLLLTTVAPLLIYQYYFFPTLELPPPDGLSMGSCLIPRDTRLPCGVEEVTPAQCDPQCCYDHQNNLCFQRYHSRFSYFHRGNWSENVDLTPRTATVPYASQKSYKNIKLSVDEVSPSHLTFTFHNSDHKTGRRREDKNYTYSITEHNEEQDVEKVNIIVNATQGNIFNTLRGPIIASDNIWEITFKLTNETMYGLGEIPLRPDTVKILYNHKGGLNSVPLIFARLNGSYHGLLLEAMAPTEVIIRKDYQLVIRSITSSGLKFHLFVGPTPIDITKDVISIIGVSENLDYWMFGPHVCREGTSSDPLSELRSFISTSTTQRLPFDSHCGATPIVFETECLRSNALVDLVNQGANQIINARKKFMPHVSPFIKYIPLPKPEVKEADDEDAEKTTESNETPLTTTEAAIVPTTEESTNRCFDDDQFAQFNIHDANGKYLYEGKVDNHTVIYPSYITASEEFMKSLWLYDINFDAVILENDWPLDESEKDDEVYRILPYFNEYFEAAFNKTPLWNATRLEEKVTNSEEDNDSPSIENDEDDAPSVDTESFHGSVDNDTISGENTTKSAEVTTEPPIEFISEKYLVRHNDYGNQFAKAFGMIKGSIPTISSSQWMNGNVIINRQSVPTSWSSLQRELIEASLGGISGHWYWSSPICGDTENFNSTTQIRLCAKWYMASVYMPLIKIHSKVVPRDPLAFEGNDRAHMMAALNTRMSLLPYIYTVLKEGPLLRPMFFQYPFSERLVNLTTQFAVGNDLLIVPNLQPQQSHVHVRMPPGTWYEFWGGLKMVGEEGEAVTMTTTEADFFSMVRGGSIIVMQKNTQVTAELTRLHSAYTLVIALGCETVTLATEPPTTTEATVTTENNRNNTTEKTNITEVRDITTKGTTLTDDNEGKAITEMPEETVTTCNATGKLYMDESMIITFHANATSLTISSEGTAYQLFCAMHIAIWSRTVNQLLIFGLGQEENNYDEKKLINLSIDLCHLASGEDIVYHFVS